MSPTSTRILLFNFSQVAFMALAVLALTGAKELLPGEIILQESVAYRTEGRELQEAGDLTRAAAAYRKAVTANPKYAEAYNDLGVVVETLGDLKHAEAAYKMAVSLDPQLGSAHTNLALLYEETGRIELASQHWAARIRIGPSEDPWVVRARQRMEHYSLAVPEPPPPPHQSKTEQARFALSAGKAHLEQKRWDLAREEFRRAADLDPASREARRFLKVVDDRQQAQQWEENRQVNYSHRRVEVDLERSHREQAAIKAKAEKRALEIQEADQTQAAEAARKAQWTQDQEHKRLKGDAKRQAQIEAAQAKREAAQAARQAKIEAAAAKRQAKVDAAAAKRQAQIDAAAAKRQSRETSQRELAIDRAARSATPPPITPVVRSTPLVQEPAAPAPVVAPAQLSQQPSARDAQVLAREVAQEKSQTRLRTTQELLKRAQSSMREGQYAQAGETYRQILLLEPANREAKQGLERSEKAARTQAQQEAVSLADERF